MRSSRGFASTATNPKDAHFGLAFAGAPRQRRFRFGYVSKTLNLAGDGKSPDHYAKGTPSPRVHPKMDEPGSDRL